MSNGRLRYEAPPVHPAGAYIGRLNEIEIKNGDDDRVYLKWHFTSRSRKGTPITISDNSSCNFGPRSKPREWAEVLLGRRLTKEEAREGIEFSELVGCECQILLSVVEKDGELHNKIERLTAIDDEDEDEEATE